jgi:hypothetical protein
LIDLLIYWFIDEPEHFTGYRAHVQWISWYLWFIRNWTFWNETSFVPDSFSWENSRYRGEDFVWIILISCDNPRRNMTFLGDESISFFIFLIISSINFVWSNCQWLDLQIKWFLLEDDHLETKLSNEKESDSEWTKSNEWWFGFQLYLHGVNTIVYMMTMPEHLNISTFFWKVWPSRKNQRLFHLLSG